MSDELLTKYFQKNVDEAQKELESEGYIVHIQTRGRYHNPIVPPLPDGTATHEKHVLLSINEDDPERKIINARVHEN